MIRKVIVAIVLIVAGAALMYYALGRHFVETAEETIIVPKEKLSLADTWVDISEWEREDFQEHPELTRALIENGQEDLVPRTAGDKLRDWLKDRAGEVLEGQ